MARQPRLDTTQRAHQAYSFNETPIELNVSASQNQDAASSIGNTTVGSPDANFRPQPAAERPWPEPNVASQELAHARQMRLQDGQIPVTSKNGPPVHPALFAPYADDMDGRQDQQSAPPTSLPSPYHSPPHSPGPLPVKEHPRPLPLQALSIAPDANPLQSPRSPPVRSATFPTDPQTPHAVNEVLPNHLPGQVAHPNQIIQGGNWSSGLCECSDIGTCCLGLACPCILYGRTQHRLSRKSRREDPTNLLGYETCNASCTAMSLLCGCQWLLATIQHTRTRKAYAIEGDVCNDCVRATCCTCCILIQDEREIKKREETRAYSAQLTGASFGSPYLPPGQMQYGQAPT
jgi:Cys-rich protein (TIGR01571 family)